MERVRAALLDSGAEEELWDEALASVVHVLNRSPKAGLDVTPLEALTGRRPNVAGFRFWGSRAWALKPKKPQQKLEPRTDVGRFVGYTVGGKAYRILENGSNKVFERRDVLMEENPTKAGTSPVDSSAGPQLTMTEDSDNKGDMDGEMDMLDAEGGGGEKHLPEEDSESDSDGDPDDLADDNDDEEGQSDTASIHPVGHSAAEMDNAAAGPRHSTRRPAPKVTWWEKDPKAYLANGAESEARDGWDLTKPPADEKEARARPDWPLWQKAIKDEVVAHKQLGTWSRTKVSNKKQKTVKTRFVLDIKHDAEGKMARYKARLAAQGFNQVPGRDFDETWAQASNAATTRAILAGAAAKDWEIHHVDVTKAFLNAKMDKEMDIKLPDGVEDGDPWEMCRLSLALYGKKQAGRLWAMKLDKKHKDMGASRSPVDPSVYEWNQPVHGRVFILVYLDDLIVAGKSLAGVKAVKSAASRKFEVRDKAEVKDVIGIKVMRDRKASTITLSNPGHTAALLEAFVMEMATHNKNPMASGVKLAKTGNDLVTTPPADPTQSGERRARPCRRVVLSENPRPGRRPRRAHTHSVDRGKTPRATNTSCVTGSLLARVEGLAATLTPRPLIPSLPLRPSEKPPLKHPQGTLRKPSENPLSDTLIGASENPPLRAHGASRSGGRPQLRTPP